MSWPAVMANETMVLLTRYRLRSPWSQASCIVERVRSTGRRARGIPSTVW